MVIALRAPIRQSPQSTLSPAKIGRLAKRLEAWSPEDILRWSYEHFGRGVAFGTGFGAEGCVLIDMAARANIPLDVFTLDTGLFFAQTYALWRRLEKRYGVTIRAVRPELSLGEQESLYGSRLWKRDPEVCCALRKVQPLRVALVSASAWVTALRRDQATTRQGAAVLAWHEGFSLTKINPLVRWTAANVWSYVAQHEVPTNPLHEQGYPSIGCAPCTSPVRQGEDPRAGRWRGTSKTECGIHGGSNPELPIVDGASHG